MRILLAILCLAICSAAVAQSPSLSVRFAMDMKDDVTAISKYKIEMKICEPVKRTDKDGWFTNDTSDINFSVLTAADIICGNYMLEGQGKEVLSGEKEGPKNFSYAYSNQHFAWESILIFRITNKSSRGLQQSMYIIMPVRYKSFVTSITINDVAYRSGNVIFIDNAAASYPKQRLTINHSLKNEKGIHVQDSYFSSWVEE